MKLLYSKAARTISSYPGTVLALSLFLILLCSVGLYRITIDTSVDGVFPDDHPLVLELQDFNKAFVSDEKILIGIQTDDLFGQDSIAFLRNLSSALSDFPEVAKVVGLPTLKVPYGKDQQLSFQSALETDPDILLSHPLFQSTLVSSDGQATLLQLYPDGDWPPDFPGRLISFVKGMSNDTMKLYIAGVPVLEQEVVRSIYHDLFYLPPIVTCILVIFLVFIWRDWTSTCLCLAAVSLTMTATLGMMGWASIPITVLTPILPPLLMAATFASAAHVLSAFKKFGSTDLESVFDGVFSPCLFAVLTTGVGFGSLIFNPVVQVKEFGLFAMLGILISFFVVFGCVVPLACIVNIRKGKTRSFFFMETLLHRLNTYTEHNYKVIISCFSGVMLLLIVFLPGLKVDISIFDNIDPDGEVYKSYQFFQDHFSGVSTLELDLQAKSGSILEPEVLMGMLSLSGELKGDERVNASMSIGDFIAYLNGLVSPQMDLSTQTADGIGQLLFLYRLSGYDTVIGDYITRERGRARLTLMVGNISASEFFTLSEKVKKLAHTHLPENVKITVTGSVEMYSQLNRLLFSGLVKSLGMAFIIIGGLLIIFLRSIRLGVLAFLPNTFPLVIIYGTMRLFDLPIDAQTAMVGCISLGISVDGTVHFLHNYQSIPTNVSRSARIHQVWLSTGIPVLIATLILIVVFSLLCISSFRPIQIFGLLSSIGLLAALWADLVYLPALFYIRNRTVK